MFPTYIVMCVERRLTVTVQDGTQMKNTMFVKSANLMRRMRKMIDEKNLKRLVNGSMEYFVKNGILTIRDYYAVNDRYIEIDLSKLTLDILEKLSPDNKEEEEEDDE
jgi:predicted transcriptional regulator